MNVKIKVHTKETLKKTHKQKTLNKHTKKTQRKHPINLVLKGYPKQRHLWRKIRKCATGPFTGFLSLVHHYTYAAEVIFVVAVASNLCSSQNSHVDLLLTNKQQTKLGSWHNQNNVPVVHFCIVSISTCIVHVCSDQSLVMFGY